MNQLAAAYEAMGKSGVAINITTTMPELAEFAQMLISRSQDLAKKAIRNGEDELLLNVEEAMKRLQIKDRSTLWRWAQRGYLIPIRSGRKTLYKASDIDLILSKKV